MENAVIIRFGEVFLKKGNRAQFMKQLRRNLRDSLKRIGQVEGVTLTSYHGRYEISREEDQPFDEAELARLVDAVTSTFGIVSASPAIKTELEYDAIKEAVVTLADREIEERRVDTFKIDASRAFKRFPMTSPELGRQLGSAVIEKHPLPVRMKNPDLTVGVEIHEHGAYVHARRVPAPGGLPVGSSGKAVLLLSGGIDSPVAGWMMAKRGCFLRPIHFHSYPYTSKRSVEKVKALAQTLSRWTGPLRMTSISITPIQEYLRESIPNDKLVLFYRRSMVRLASRLAAEVHAKALITGESLGQVASQTMENMAVVGQAATLPIFQPLVGMDKMETVALARKIGTYETSIEPHDDCCSLFLPPHPETKGKVDRILAMEEELADLARLEDEAWEGREDFIVGAP
jgi:tRNA uracil 4-sulfurtransferase